jgi:predicted transcriptional regulator
MRLYTFGETIPLIARSVGWSEGRVRKRLREAGVALTEEGEALRRMNSEEARRRRRRLLVAGWEASMQGGLAPSGRERKLVFTRGGVRDIGG